MKIIIARHGNTFDKGDVIRRVGLRTDLPLSNSGQAQAEALGQTLAKQFGRFDACYVSELQRTQQTAKEILEACGQPIDYQIRSELNEVDYGDDDGEPEAEVVARLGEAAIQAWDNEDSVPEGWHIDPDIIRSHWRRLDTEWREADLDTVLVVTSNGIARFVDALLADGDDYFAQQSKKLKTAHFAVLEVEGSAIKVRSWNHAPSLIR